jgi:hypothetical protein
MHHNRVRPQVASFPRVLGNCASAFAEPLSVVVGFLSEPSGWQNDHLGTATAYLALTGGTFVFPAPRSARSIVRPGFDAIQSDTAPTCSAR